MMEVEAVVAQGTLKVTCPRDELARALGVVSRGVSKRTTAEVSVESEGSAVVPGRLLLELARLLPDADVTIEHKLEEAAVEVRSGAATYRLHTYNAEDFPRLPDAETA